MGTAQGKQWTEVLQRMQTKPNDAQMQKQGLREMGSFTNDFNDDAAVGQLAQQQVVDVLTQALQKHSEDRVIAIDASHALYRILRLRPDRRSARAVPGLLAALRWRHGWTALALALLCSGLPAARHEALRRGAVEELRAAWEAEPGFRPYFAWSAFATVQGDGEQLLRLAREDEWVERLKKMQQAFTSEDRRRFPTVAGELDALVQLVEEVKRTGRPPASPDGKAAAEYPASADAKVNDKEANQPKDNKEVQETGRPPAAAGYPASPDQKVEPEAAKTEKTPEVAQAQKELQDAIASRSLGDLKAAIAAAKKVGVSPELREKALEVQAELLELKADSPKSMPSSSRGSLIDVAGATPIGLQVCHACEKIYKFLQEPELSNGDGELEDLCRRSKLPDAVPDLKNSIFGLMEPEDIKIFLQAPDHQLWQQIKKNTEEFIRLLKKAPGVPYSVQEMTPEAKNPKVRTIRPVVMDQSVREPATNTPFGHTGYQKYLTLQIVKHMGFKDIAISGQYYGTSYTPETQILEWMKVKGETMDGMIVMFAPGKGDRDAGIKAIKDFGIPNAFLDLTMKASVRFKQSDFVSSVLDTVEILDHIFTGMGFKPNPWRTDEEVNDIPGEGEISVNLVDLMEFLNLKPDGTMDDQRKAEAERAFDTWKSSEAFRRRVVGILTEEGRGRANYKDYGVLSKWLRNHFPQDEHYRILVHAHGGDGNTQDAASVEAVLNGANGVWAAVIPQAAQSGHNSSMVFLENMVQMGNEYVLDDFWLHQGVDCARHIYYLNFNSYAIPDDCPIWGARIDQLLHTAFSTVSGEEWRRTRGKYYNEWKPEARIEIDRMTSTDTDLHKSVAQFRTQSGRGNYRISPLVSDAEIWRNRIYEVQENVLGHKERVGDYHNQVRDLGFALMNAGIRANLNEPATLKQLWDIAKRNKTKDIRCAAYLKAQQHQGERE